MQVKPVIDSTFAGQFHRFARGNGSEFHEYRYLLRFRKRLSDLLCQLIYGRMQIEFMLK